MQSHNPVTLQGCYCNAGITTSSNGAAWLPTCSAPSRQTQTRYTCGTIPLSCHSLVSLQPRFRAPGLLREYLSHPVQVFGGVLACSVFAIFEPLNPLGAEPQLQTLCVFSDISGPVPI